MAMPDDIEWECPDCGAMYVSAPEDAEPPCCNRAAMRGEIERLHSAIRDIYAAMNTMENPLATFMLAELVRSIPSVSRKEDDDA